MLPKCVILIELLEGVSYASIANSLTGVVGPSIAYSILGANYDRFKLLLLFHY